MSDRDEWPSFASELARKALAKLEQTIERNTAGVISERELYLVTDAIYDSVSGLVDKKDLDVIGAVHHDIRQRAKAARLNRSVH